MHTPVLETAIRQPSEFGTSFVLIDRHVNLAAIVGYGPEVSGLAGEIAGNVDGNPLRDRCRAGRAQPGQQELMGFARMTRTDPGWQMTAR